MQPYLFPYIGYYQLAAAVDQFLFYDDVNFIKQGWINRNQVLLNGSVHRFTLPLSKVSSFDLIKDVEIDKDKYPRWRTKFLKTLDQAYIRAPYHKPVLGLVESVLRPQATHISELALGSLTAVMEYVARRSPVVGSSSAFGSGDKKAQERILDLCERLGATHYINAVGGRGLYDRRAFLEHSVELAFLTPRFTAYQQGQAEFTPGLSIIDVLMFNSPERVNAMLDNYELD